MRFEALEPRNLLAGIHFDAPSGVVTIAGDAGADNGSFAFFGSTNYRATLNQTTTRDFSFTEVNRVVFIGFDGNDTFDNRTGVPSQLLGGNGVDTLRGGSGNDVINGGAGDNILFGNEGNDRIFAGAGNDTIFGGFEDDRIFGGDGRNEIHGGEGDDFIFGGSNVDQIFGDDGADQIFGLGGDDILSAGAGGVAGSFGTTQADLILGNDGDDHFLGGTGLNVFYGGDGDDDLRGGNGENRLHGQNGDDNITGGAVADYIAGAAGDDMIFSSGGNDYIIPGAGDNLVEAGLGVDFVQFSGDFTDYRLSASGSTLTVANKDQRFGGTDTIVNAERIRFDDGDFNTSDRITQRVTIQPIIVSNDNGINRAEFFGNILNETDILEQIDEIFLQAFVDVEWLPETRYRNTFANVGNADVRPLSDLNAIVQAGDAAGVGNSDPLVLDMYFVEVAPGFGDTGESRANGLALLNANGIAMHSGDFLPGSVGGRSVLARVAAHEIAHNLGLTHVDDPNNLLNAGREITASQRSTILGSRFSVPI